MKKTYEDVALIAQNPLYQAFELTTDTPPRGDDHPIEVPSEGGRTDYRVWRCNGVSIGLRIHKARS